MNFLFIMAFSFWCTGQKFHQWEFMLSMAWRVICKSSNVRYKLSFYLWDLLQALLTISVMSKSELIFDIQSDFFYQHNSHYKCHCLAWICQVVHTPTLSQLLIAISGNDNHNNILFRSLHLQVTLKKIGLKQQMVIHTCKCSIKGVIHVKAEEASG